MMNKLKKMIATSLAFMMMFNFAFVMPQSNVEARATEYTMEDEIDAYNQENDVGTDNLEDEMESSDLENDVDTDRLEDETESSDLENDVDTDTLEDETESSDLENDVGTDSLEDETESSDLENEVDTDSLEAEMDTSNLELEAASANFSSSPTYTLDFSRITAAAASNRQTVAAGSLITTMPGVTRTVGSGALQSSFNMTPAGGTIRASGSGTNTFIDPNGQNRRLESTVQLTGPIRVVVTGRSSVASSMTTATLNFGGRSITRNVTSSNSDWTSVTFDFPDGRGILSLDWPWTATNRLGVQRIEIYEGAVTTFPTTSTYALDFSRITATAASNRQTVAAGSLITTMPGVTRNVVSGARQPNFNMMPAGGTVRASGSGTNTFIDPNGQNRRLESTVQLTGPIRVVVTGRSSVSGSMATATLNFGDQSITQNVSSSNSDWTRVTFDFPDGQGILSLDWPWTTTNRLGVQRIEIFEGDPTSTYALDFSRITATAASNRQTVAAGSLITTMPGVTRTVAPGALQSNFNMTPAGGTIRASGSGNNTFIDPNGQNRRLESTVELTGPIRVVVTGRSSVSGSMATATLNFGGRSITHNVSSSNSDWTRVTFDFPDGRGILSLDWPWTATNRLGVQRIEIFEGVATDGGNPETFPVVEYRHLNSQPASWYGGAHSILIADNLLVMQRNNGGWPRGTGQGGTNFPTNLAVMTDAERQHHRNNRHLIDSYYGRGITTNETRYMLRMYEATRDMRYREAGMRGFNAILNSQYSNGGWPYYVTDRSLYRSAISFKDNAIPDILHLLRDISNGMFPTISSADRTRADRAFDNGVEAILNLQIWYDANGRHLGRTWSSNAHMGAWAANSDHATMNPRWARQFEPPSIGGLETVRIIEFLMTIDNPNVRVKRAISGGVIFTAYTEIFGYTHPTVSGDRRLVRTNGARDLWARFLCVETLTPLFYDRQNPNAHPTNPPANQWLGVLSSQDTTHRRDSTGGIRRNLNTNGQIFNFGSNQTLDLVRSYANISFERRNGYQYVGTYGRNLPAQYETWRQRN